MVQTDPAILTYPLVPEGRAALGCRPMSEERSRDGKPILRNARGALIKGTGHLPGAGRKIENWRHWLRTKTNNGSELHEILLELARGKPKTVELLDGRQTVIIPTAETMARCAIHLDEMLHGKAVTQNEQQRAEREAGAMAAVQALSDEVLADRVSKALAARGVIDAEYFEAVPMALQIWDEDVGQLTEE